MIGGRTFVNLVAIAVASAALLVYAFTQLLAGALFDSTYPLHVRLPQSGGLLAGQEVTLAGRTIGTVDGVELDGGGVVATLGIFADERVPEDVAVTVLRRSAVGEQAIDFRPATGQPPFYEPGDVIEPSSVTTPIAVQRLLELADDVLGDVDPENAAALIAELADTVRGRRDDLRAVLVHSADFSEALADSSEEFDRFFASSAVVNAELAEHRETLARSIGEMADAASVLADMRRPFEELLVEAPPVLTQVGGIVDRSQPNVACVVNDLADLNTFVSLPENYDNAGEALRLNRWFFIAFHILAPTDDFGEIWNRIQFIPPQEPPPQSYLPEKRPVPDILPGGACSSPFGEGAPAATQDDFAGPVTLENSIIPPANNRTTPVRTGGPPLGSGVGAPAPPGRGVIPATGGAGLPFLVGAALLLVAARTVRK